MIDRKMELEIILYINILMELILLHYVILLRVLS